MAILFLASAGIIGWYAYILAYAPGKIVSQTYEVGTQKVTLADGSTETRSFMDVNVFKNEFDFIANELELASFYSTNKDFNEYLNLQAKALRTASLRHKAPPPRSQEVFPFLCFYS